jgi:hypothetical protein
MSKLVSVKHKLFNKEESCTASQVTPSGTASTYRDTVLSRSGGSHLSQPASTIDGPDGPGLIRQETNYGSEITVTPIAPDDDDAITPAPRR